MRDPCVFCSGEACPGSCRRTKKAESPTQGAPPPAPAPQKQPKLVSRGGGAMSGIAQRLYQQHQRTQSRAAADPKRTLGKAEVRAHALSFVGRQARHLPEAELVAGAAHHLARLHKAVQLDERVVAARHAHAYSIYERLLGHVPSDQGSPAVDRRCKIEGSSLVKSEVKSFEAFRRDQQVRETVLWSETLEKATKKKDDIPDSGEKPGEGDVVLVGLDAVRGVGGKHKWRVTCVDGDTVYVKGINHGGPQEIACHTSRIRVVQRASEVKKALPAPDPQGPKIPKPPVAGAPIAAERKAKFGNKTSATAPTAAPTPKPPSMPTKATTKAPKVPAAPKPAGAPKAPNQSSGSR